jgi:hypothetical protein
MSALSVVEDLDVLEQGGARLRVRAEGVPGEQFTFQGGEEALGQRVIVARGDVGSTWKAMKMGPCSVAYCRSEAAGRDRGELVR